MNLLERADHVTSRIEGLLVGGKWLFLGGFALWLVGMCALISRSRPANYEELSAIYLSRFDSAGELRDNLRAGAGQSPPGCIVLIRTATALLGEGLVASRLPSILAFTLACVLAQRFVARRSTELLGWGAVFLLASNPLLLSFSCRACPGALVVLGGMAALLLWRPALDGPRRLGASLGLMACLTLVVWCDYHAILLLVPFSLGAFVVLLRRRILPLHLLTPLAVPLAGLALLTPLLSGGFAMPGDAGDRPRWAELGAAYGQLALSLWPAVLMLLVYQALVRQRYWEPRPSQIVTNDSEFVILTGLLLLPAADVLLAGVTTSVFGPRHVLPEFVAAGVVLTLLAQRHSPRAEFPRLLLVVLLGGWGAVSLAATLTSVRKEAQVRRETLEMVERAGDPRLPVAVADGKEFLALQALGGGAVQARLIYPASCEIPRGQGKPHRVDRELKALRGVEPVRVVSWRRFLRDHKQFLLLANERGWLLEELLTSNAELTLLAEKGTRRVYRVRLQETSGLP
jgi:hypothetical protein